MKYFMSGPDGDDSEVNDQDLAEANVDLADDDEDASEESSEETQEDDLDSLDELNEKEAVTQ